MRYTHSHMNQFTTNARPIVKTKAIIVVVSSTIWMIHSSKIELPSLRFNWTIHCRHKASKSTAMPTVMKTPP